MGELDDKRSGPTRESGKRLYVSPQDYQAQIRRGTIKGYDRGDAPWSEFEKPYWEDSYEEMEYFMWNWPGFAPWRWEFSIDNPSLPTTQESGLGVSFLVFACQVYGGFCPGETRCVVLDCSHPVIGAALSNRWAEREFSLSFESETSLCITAVEDSALGVEVDIFMQSEAGVRGSADDILIGTAVDCEDCDTADPLEASPDNPTTVTDSTNYYIAVLNGVGPFSWSVSAPQSPDVSLQWAGGSRRYNYLQVTDGCGSIIVTVVDSCGTVVDMGFFSDDGTWQDCQGSGRGGSGCLCTPSSIEINGPTYGNGVPSNDEWRYTYSGYLQRMWRSISTDCDGLNFPTCCQNQSPDCSPSPTCLAVTLPATCWNYGYPGVPVPCFNDCGGKGATPKCGIGIRTNDAVAIQFWRCA